eukprot:1703546-Pleurochrysis_carterae.AAC.1
MVMDAVSVIVTVIVTTVASTQAAFACVLVMLGQAFASPTLRAALEDENSTVGPASEAAGNKEQPPASPEHKVKPPLAFASYSGKSHRARRLVHEKVARKSAKKNAENGVV